MQSIEQQTAVDIHGTQCIHTTTNLDGSVFSCTKPANQKIGQKHGWLCSKHNWAVKYGRKK